MGKEDKQGEEGAALLVLPLAAGSGRPAILVLSVWLDKVDQGQGTASLVRPQETVRG